MSLREKSIQLARESDAKAAALRRKIEEEELKQVREAFNKKFGEYPDRVWASYPFFYADKEGLTFKIFLNSNGSIPTIQYFYITTSVPPYNVLSDKLDSLIDLGRFLNARRDMVYFDDDPYKRVFGVAPKEKEQIVEKEELKEPEVKKDKPRRMLRINDNQEDGRTGDRD
jgi:hypothetical protein